MEDNLLFVIVLLVVGAYLYFYVSTRTYLEKFTQEQWAAQVDPVTGNTYYQSTSGQTTWKHNPSMVMADAATAASMTAAAPPVSSATTTISAAMPSPDNSDPAAGQAMALSQPKDEYEVGAIYQNRGSREASKQQLNDAMTRYPLDWSVQNPDSQFFQENQVKYVKEKKDAVQPAPYSPTAPRDASLPDRAAMEEEERTILKTYQPQSSKGLLQYSVDDVKSMLEKVYVKRGLLPVVEKSKQGDNIWEITELIEKNPKIVWEDDTEEKQQLRGEQTITVPHPASDLAAGLNPFMNPRQRVGNGTHEVQQWTPGVDRMFQPTHPVPQWQ